jgi:hypothetical protein
MHRKLQSIYINGNAIGFYKNLLVIYLTALLVSQDTVSIMVDNEFARTLKEGGFCVNCKVLCRNLSEEALIAHSRKATKSGNSAPICIKLSSRRV